MLNNTLKKTFFSNRSDVLIAYGKKASLSSETRKFYKALYETRKDNKQSLVNCPLLVVEDAGDVISESPDRLAVSLQFFLQGLGENYYLNIYYFICTFN